MIVVPVFTGPGMLVASIAGIYDESYRNSVVTALG